jgi:hypothetical protein
MTPTLRYGDRRREELVFAIVLIRLLWAVVAVVVFVPRIVGDLEDEEESSCMLSSSSSSSSALLTGLGGFSSDRSWLLLLLAELLSAVDSTTMMMKFVFFVFFLTPEMGFGWSSCRGMDSKRVEGFPKRGMTKLQYFLARAILIDLSLFWSQQQQQQRQNQHGPDR